MWKLVFGALGLVLALLGPVGFVRRFVRKFGIWAVAASIVYLAVWILRNGHVGRLWHEGGHGGSFWLGVDLVIALTVSWVPLVADYTRFSRDRRSAFVGAGLGYLLPTLFQFGFGAILVLSHPSISGPTDVLTTVAAGGVGSLLALLALTVDETDEAFANIYSTAVSLQNVVPRASQRAADRDRLGARDRISLGINLTRYQQFLLLLGAFFVPLFGVLLADWLVAGRHYTARARLRRAALAAGHDRLVARRLRALRVARADAGPRLLDALARQPAPAERRRSARRCRASRSRSRSRSPSRA